VELRLPAWIREVVRTTAGQLRDLYASETADDDPAIARLFPTAYLDDPLANLTLDDRIAGELRAGRLEAIAVVERTAGATRLTVDEADAWVRTLNDARLVLGVRLEVTEETTEDDRRGDPAYQHYLVLSQVVEGLIQALSGA
jgi:hypothetical protein